MRLRPSLHLGVVAIEKGAFGSPSTKIANNFYIVEYLIIIGGGILVSMLVFKEV